MTHPSAYTVALLAQIVTLAFLSHGVARIFVLDSIGIKVHGWLMHRGWIATYVSTEGVATEAKAPPQGQTLTTVRDRPSTEYVVLGVHVHSPWPISLRFMWHLLSCIHCTGWWTSATAWSLVNGFHPTTLSWWMGAFAVRGVQSVIGAKLA